MDIRPLHGDDCDAWANLLGTAFQRPIDDMAALLGWMQSRYEMVACGAWDGDRLAAQYSCLLMPLRVPGYAESFQVGISVNMATHLDYRGKGLVKQVAAPVYECLTERGVLAGVGFSNAEGVQVDRRSRGYGYQVVGQMQPLIALNFGKKRASPVTLTDTCPKYLPPLSSSQIRFGTCPELRFTRHPSRQYQFGVWYENKALTGLVVYRHEKRGTVSLLAAYAPNELLPELMRHWLNALRDVYLIQTVTSVSAGMRQALRQAAVCIQPPFSRTPYFLTVKPLQPDFPPALLDFAAWDCTGGDIL